MCVSNEIKEDARAKFRRPRRVAEVRACNGSVAIGSHTSMKREVTMPDKLERAVTVAAKKLEIHEKFPKLEKVEKLEIKEKPEKFEHKEKPEKVEHKEKPEKFEHKEKPEKVEHKEKLEKLELREKLIPETPKEIAEGGQPVEDGDPIEARLSAVENAVSTLQHFITTAQRPDLSQGALAAEPDTKKKGG
jgi:hypothetical protein